MTEAHAPRPAGEPDRPVRPSYEIEHEIALTGTVTSLGQIEAGPGKLVTLTVQSNSRTLEVVLCPEFALKEKNFALATGETVSVLCAPTGERYSARLVTRGTEVLLLRSQDGKPIRKEMVYDMAREVQLKGSILSVNRNEPRPGKAFITLTLAVGDEQKEVALGPEFVVEAAQVSYAAGDQVTVWCAPYGRHDKARQIACGGHVAVFPGKEGKQLG